jgi:hypothetical protein
LFRIPLRLQQYRGSLSKRVCTSEQLWDNLLDEFCERAGQSLLFLKSVRTITVHSIALGSTIRKVMHLESLTLNPKTLS